jgi:hypothetical protein
VIRLQKAAPTYQRAVPFSLHFPAARVDFCTVMLRLLPALAAIVGFLSGTSLQAGSVTFLTDQPGATGKLTLNPTAIHVDGATPADINLGDVLEADFTDEPFHLDYFSSDENPDKLPPDWQGGDIGPKDSGGSYSYAKGIFTLNSGTHEIKDWGDQTEHSYFVGRPWTGSGQWTLHLREITGSDNTPSGIILREKLDPKVGGLYQLTACNQNGGGIFMRNPGGGYYGHNPPIDIPTWLRITRSGSNLALATSRDGVAWDTVDQNITPFANDTLIGMFIPSPPKPAAASTFDHVLFTPPPSLSEILPAGVLLRSGTFLAGGFAPYEIAAKDSSGTFHRNGKDVAITADKIAAVLLYPTERHRLAHFGTQVGILLKNDDFIQGDIMAITPGDPDTVRVNSLMLGISDIGERFGQSPIDAVFFHPPALQPSAYEVRLTDGSIIRATSVASNNGQLQIAEVSGVTNAIDPAEVAQFRAGSAHAQNLLELPRKAPGSTPPPALPAPAANPGVPAPPPVNVPALPTPAVECWEGHEQQQIMVAASGVPVTFTLPGRFRAIALQVALSPDSAPNAQAVLRVLADGHEMGSTPALKPGDPPRFIQATLTDPKTITLQADSIFPGTRVLLIDPVALRDPSN